ncbi:uncharacterized protein [Engystomops pustulosus]|uniref:uncharacterized protein n=1 Tax=Engystomops pustulosus TaxID=76066 RepID=UPI003AFAFA4C
MAISATFQLILLCLLHVTCVGSLDSCLKEKRLPIEFNQINGLWNVKAIASRDTLKFLTEMHYSYAKISLTEKNGTITKFFNPIESMFPEPENFQRVHDEKETLTYRRVEQKELGLMTIFQVHPDELIMSSQSEGIVKSSVLYVRSSAHTESELEDFQEWMRCTGLTYYKEFNNTVDYAQKCYGLLEEKHLAAENKENFTSWHLVAKSSSSMDQHYNVRILYTARLEISKEEDEYTLREIITAPMDKILVELKFGMKIKDGVMVFNFMTKKDLLLLGVQTKIGRTLYLASKTPTVQESVIERFKTQALCMETKYNYFISGSIRKDDGGPEACAKLLEKMEPINFRESLGKWILTVSAHEDTSTAVHDVFFTYGDTEITVVNGKVHLSHTAIYQGTISTMDNIEVEESTGHILYKDTPTGVRTAVHSVSPKCILFSPEGQRVFLNCRANQFPSLGDISQFVKYATCRNFNKILIRQPASYLCSETPIEVDSLDVGKIAGTWKLVAVASNIPDGDVQFPNEIQFTLNNEEVTITDGTWVSKAQKIENRRIQYAKGEESTMEMRFHEPLGDSLLTWVGNPKQQKIFLVLFSKSGHARPDELTRFKHFAACLSIRVVFLKD